MKVYFNKDGWDEWTNSMIPTWKGYINTTKEWVGLIEELHINRVTRELEEHDIARRKYRFNGNTYIERDMSLFRVLVAPINFIAITSAYMLGLVIGILLLPFAFLYNIKFNFRRSNDEV